MWISSFHIAHSNAGLIYAIRNRTCQYLMANNLQGSRIRVLFSNEIGKTAAWIGGACIEKTDALGNSLGAQPVSITANGKREFRLQPGEKRYSDPIPVAVQPGEMLALRIYFPKKTVPGVICGDYASRSLPGNHCDDIPFQTDEQQDLVPRLMHLPYEVCFKLFKSLEVDTDEPIPVLSAIGDSITASCAWFEPLRKRLYESYPGQIACGNTGIAGGRLLKDSPKQFGEMFGQAGVHRFERDVLSVAGISHVIFALGTNDIGYPGHIEKKAPMPTVEEFLQAYGALTARCRERKIRTTYLAIFPRDDSFQSPLLEQRRLEINRALENSGLFDYCVNAEDALRDPNGVGCRAEYVNPDKLHLNEQGGRIVADQFDLAKLLGRE